MTLFKLGHVVGEDGADGAPGSPGAKGDKGDTGATGNGIQSIVLKSTTGKKKTYRITFTNGTTFDYDVYDGEDGSSSEVEIVTSWNNTLSDEKVPSEKLSKNSLDGKAPTSHASSSNTYGLGSTSNYGHVKTVNGLTQSSHSDGAALSAYQGKVLKDEIDAKPSASDIPTKISDLQNDSDFIETSSTSGLIKNDGSVDTTNYLPASNYVPYYYADCSTSASTQDKELTITDFNLATGVIVVVKFANANSYNGTARLKINSLAAVDIATVGTTKTSRYYWTAGEVVTFIYDGSNFVMLEGGVATTTYYGVTKLSSSTSSTSTSLAATPSAVKAAYDLANGKADVSDIPTKISELTNDSDFIEKSSTAGLIKNDGSVDTNTYLTSSSLSNYVQKSSTSGLIKNDGTIDTSAYITSSALSNYMQKSSTAGLMKNDGTVDTNTYLTSSALSNYIQKSNTSGLIKNDGTIDTSTYLTQMKIGSTSGLPVKTGTNGVLAAGSFGTSAGTFAEGNHTHSNYISTSSTTGLVKNDGTIMTSGTGSTNYAAGNHTHSSYVSGTKVTSWQSTPSDSNIPSEKLVSDTFAAIEDLIGDAITYINQ